METNKAIGKGLQFVGLFMMIMGGVNSSVAIGGTGTMVCLFGRVVAEYGDDWFA